MNFIKFTFNNKFIKLEEIENISGFKSLFFKNKKKKRNEQRCL